MVLVYYLGVAWSMNYETWPWKDMPPHLRSGGLLITGKAIGPMLAAYQTIPFLPYSELYSNGLVPLKAGVELHTNDG